MAAHRHRNRDRRTSSADADARAGTGAASSSSAAARYSAFRQRQRHASTAAARFEATLDFPLDDFQREAIDALEDGDNVLVAAPTGAGKTIVADFAMFLAHERNVKAFYTTPIKALSNQKYHDLVDVYGEDHVGLLTGDNSINSEADIVVMTTEVLRNMLYERSSTLEALRYVILDEVHYLADRFRGPVWEEVIIHLPRTVRVVGLSATVSNVEDFSQWIASVRGDTKLVVSERRPVPLEQHVLVQQDDRTEPEVLDLYLHDAKGAQTTSVDQRLIARIAQLDRQAARRQGASGHDRRPTKHPQGARERRPQRHTPRRWAVVDELNFLGMLPGIYFIFSRNGCDQAVEQCINAGLELTTDDEAMRIRAIVDEMIDGQLSDADLKTLRFSQFRFALEEGFAAHHAGMIALFRQIVERLFEEGLVKMVFATETLALGINMPARCVVVEKLEKFDGTGHVPLTPGEYTQLTGRAGRRGIDTIGHAVVVDHPGFTPQTVAALSSKRVYPLHSSFRPTFNMAVNLLNTSDYATARLTLDHSFARWEANESATQLESQIGTLERALDGYERAFACQHGDFKEFMTIRMTLADLEKGERRALKHASFTSEDARKQAWRSLDRRIAALKEREREHPCRDCPDLQRHLKWGHRWARETRELNRVRDRYDSRTGSVARQFDRICGVLLSLGYVERTRLADPYATDADHDVNYRLTERGQLLRRIYSEQDLVLAEALETGLLDGLDAPQLAAVLSGIVYESRRGGGGEPRHYPGGSEGAVANVAQGLSRLRDRLDVLCEDGGLDDLPQLDFGICDIIYEWTCGRDLATVLYDSELTGGDFVRNAKRLADVLQQVAVTAPLLGDGGARLAKVARQAVDGVDRGIVAYTGVE